MAKLVGLSRNIKLQWLNKTVQLLDENLEEEDFKKALNEYLSYEIKSETNLRKTREILMRIWYYSDSELSAYREIGRSLIRRDSDNAMCIHWSIMLLAYPVFADLSKLIGRMSEMQSIITLSQLKNKLFDEWGERTTLYHSVDKIIATMKDLGALDCEKAGQYIPSKHRISQSDVVRFVIWCAMKVDANSYYYFSDLKDFNILFPFDVSVSKEDIMNDNRFVVTTFDGQPAFSLNIVQ